MPDDIADLPRIGDAHAPLNEKVRDALRTAILSGRLKPGERLVEQRIATDLGVSRNPVREAIQALAAEGLVDSTARRGAFVAEVSAAEAREIIEVRALLEGQNARLAARRKDPVTIRRIEVLLDEGRAALAERRFDRLSALNQQFHRELAAAAHNAFFADLLEKMRQRTVRFFASTDPARQMTLWDEHAAILRAIIEGNEELAAERAAGHVMGAGQDYLAARGQDSAAQAV